MIILGHQRHAVDRVDPTCFGLQYEVPRIIHGPFSKRATRSSQKFFWMSSATANRWMRPPSRNHGMKSSRLDPASQNCLKIGQRVWGHVSSRRPSRSKSRFGRDNGRPWPASACCQSVCFTSVCHVVRPAVSPAPPKEYWPPARAVQVCLLQST